MAHHIIIITSSVPSKVQPSQSLLTLSNVSHDGTTYVKSGDTVSWIIDIEEITSILIKDDVHTDLFEPDPQPIADSQPDSEWSGTVRATNLQVNIKNFTS